MFLEECKFVVKEKKIHEYIIDDIEILSDSSAENAENSDWENSDRENSVRENSDEENLTK